MPKVNSVDALCRAPVASAPIRKAPTRVPSLHLRLLLTCLLFSAAAFLPARVVLAGTQTGPNFVVNSLADTDDGACDASGQGTGNQDCTLREAIHTANPYGDRAVISFSVSGTITLGSTLPNITTACRIDGSGQRIIISGNNSTGIFQLTGGLSSYSYGAYTVAFNALTIANSSGSAMSVQGASALVTNCLFANNSGSYGGAIHVGLSSTATIANCTFFNNSAVSGGAIYADADYQPNHFFDALYIYSSTFYNNHASFGTGQYNLAAADIYATGATTAEIRNTVLVNTDNRGTDQEDNAQGLTYADHSDIFNVDIDSQSFNATQATAAQINLDTNLNDNGGSTQTLALLPGSVAINAGNNSAATGAPVNNQDQRGYVRVRPGDATCDVGAYESGAGGSLVVTTAADLTSATAGQNSLRTAVAYAQQLGGAQTVTFAPPLGGQTLTLSNAWNNTDSYRSTSALSIESGSITIQGPTAAPGITLNVANGAQLRHFLVSPNTALTLSNLTLSGGRALTSGFAYGGAIWTFGSLTVRNCTFTGNTAGSEGGAIQSWGDSPSLLIENSTFTANHANGVAGALDSGAASMTFRYVTISNNTSNDGNALVIWGHPLTMVDSLIAGNASEGVASVNGGTFSAASTNNILSSATAPGLSNGVNSNQTGVPAAQLKLGPLANNGGPTPTIALQPGSVAVDAGVAIAGLTTDQVGTTRPQGSTPDVGSFELIPTLTTGIYADVNGQGGNGAGSLIGYPGGTTPGFPLFRGLNSPTGMTFDNVGNLYYATYDSSSRYCTVYKLGQGSSSPQNITSFFHERPTSAAINSAGDFLYVFSNPDSGTATRIWKVSLTSGAVGVAYFSAAFSCAGGAVDAADNLFVADTTNQQILKIPTQGGNSSVFASAVSARGLAFDASGNLFASTNGNPGNDSILKYTPAGVKSTFASGLANVPLGIAFDSNGSLFVAETGAANNPGDIIKITPDGNKSAFDSNLGPALPGGNGGPQYLAIFPVGLTASIPTVSPLGGTYQNSVQVTITSSSPGTTMRYTLDGSTPSQTNGQIYSGPFTLMQSTTLKAIAYGPGWIDSPIVSVAYTVLPPLPYWRNLQGLAANGSQDLAAPAGDGISNLLKYAFNMAPNAGDINKPNVSVLPENGTAGLPFIGVDGQGRLVIEFVRRKASSNPGISYTVETGAAVDDLNTLDLTGASVVAIDATWERVTATDPATTLTRFGRVRVTVAP